MVCAWVWQLVYAIRTSWGVKRNTAFEATGSHMRGWRQGEPGAIKEFVEQEVCASGSGGVRVLNPE